MRVLVVHPDATIAKAIATALQAEGHAVTSLPDGERAIDRFVQEPADAIVLDLVLPGRDGGATVESIRWAPGGAKAAVVLLGTTEKKPDRVEGTARRVAATAWFIGEPSPEKIAAALTPIGKSVTEPTRVAPVAELEAALAAAIPTLESRAGHDATRVAPDVQATAKGVLSDATTSSRTSSPPVHDPSPPTKPKLDLTASASYQLDPRAFDEDLHTEVEEEDDEDWARTDTAAAMEGADVEAKAAEIKDLSDIEGDLASVPFPRLLCRVASRRATGALVVSRPEDVRPTTTGETPKKVVFFRSGVPVYVKSNLVQECLGQVLARGRAISSSALAESVQRMRQGEGRQGAILIAMGVLTPHALRDALEEQLRLKLFDLFAWPTGTFRFTERMAPPAEIVTLELGLSEIVFEGVVKRIPAQRLLDALAPKMELYVVPDSRRVNRFRKIEMAPEAKKIANAIDGRQTLREVLAMAGRRPGAAAQLVYAMECVEAIRFSPQAAQLTWEAEESDPVGGPRERDAESGLVRDLGAAREELEQLARMLRAEKWSEALGVVPGDLAGAQRASEALQQRFKALTLPGAAPREIRQLAYEVTARLASAPQRLAGRSDAPPPTSVAKRKDIKDKIAGASSGSQPVPPSESPPAPSTSAAQPVPQVTATSGPAIVQPMFVEDEYTTIPRAPAMRGPIDPPAVLIGSATPAAPAAAVAPAPTPSSSPPPKLDAAEQSRLLDVRVEKMFQAEGHFRRGEKAIGRGRFADALAAFEHAVELAPDEGEFLAWLGYARYAAHGEDAQETSRSLEELARGCTLAPKLDVAHLLQARVLRAIGNASAALDAYERALAANPDCREAYDAVRELARG